ncbi:hypothetical protein [Priestia megaterium]|jgi:hypothetical protein|uniref:hypothetical protein n=1 Tax=Priestia megaterium TaxID=1404 RepID=UPI000BF3E953|nr:hypothetical protein [Priestia megaterium]PFP09229.1 hypothetical protein COJ90_21180 [Priestia megaterium]
MKDYLTSLVVSQHYALGASGLFGSLQKLVNAIFSNIFNLGATIFGIGILFCALMAAFGGEEGKQKFQKGLVICIIAFVVFLLAKAIIAFIKTNT